MSSAARQNSVNLIADPWEWPCSGPLSASRREEKYNSFKFRLHWSLLWHHEVRVLDTFPLFNPDFECYFREQRRDATSKAAFIGLMGPSDDGGLRIVLRRNSDGKTKFDKLDEVDQLHVHGNKNFIWYPDAIPSRSVARELDSYCEPYSTFYSMGDHSNQVEKAFIAAFHESSELGQVYEGFSDIRDALMFKPGFFQEFQKLVDGRWRRSVLYKLLGWGVNAQRTEIAPHRIIDSLEPRLRRHIRARFRLLSDSSYHMAIDSDLGIGSRFPGELPPAELLPLFRQGCVIPDPDDTDINFAKLTLLDKEAGLACLEGDIKLLLRYVREMPIDRIYNLRERKTFKDYRKLYAMFLAKGSNVEAKLATAITRQVRACLKEIGTECGLPIHDSRANRAIVALARFPLTSTAIAIGLVLILKNPFWGLAKPGLDYLFNIASFTQPIGSKRNPSRFRVGEMGSVKML